VLLRCAAEDATVDDWLDAVALRTKGGSFASGIPGVHAVTAHMDGADRVAMRVGAHLVAIAPPDRAREAARRLSSAAVPAHVTRREALRWLLPNPHGEQPQMFPATTSEVRLWVQPATDGGADFWLEADHPSSATAGVASKAFEREVAAQNVFFVHIVTDGLFDHLEVTTVSRTMRAHVRATEAQVNTLEQLLGQWLGAGSGASASGP
jgi:hypothetical protein